MMDVTRINNRLFRLPVGISLRDLAGKIKLLLREKPDCLLKIGFRGPAAADDMLQAKHQLLHIDMHLTAVHADGNQLPAVF